MNWLILDFTIVILFFIFIFSGFRVGLVKSLLSLINIALSLFISIYVSFGLSNLIYNQFIKENLINELQTSIDNSSINSESLISTFPNFISNSFSYYGITSKDLTDIINSGKEDIAYQILDVISPMFIQIIHLSLSMVLFFVFIIIFNIMSKWILSIFKIPVLSQINHLFGGILGILKGYLIVTLLIFCLRSWAQSTNYNSNLFSYSSIESTFIFKHIYTNNLIYNIIQEM